MQASVLTVLGGETEVHDLEYLHCCHACAQPASSAVERERPHSRDRAPAEGLLTRHGCVRVCVRFLCCCRTGFSYLEVAAYALDSRLLTDSDSLCTAKAL